jgi:hypothetical protein
MSGYNTNRHSIYNTSSSNSMVIALLRSKIKSMEKDHHHHHRGLDDDPSMQQQQLKQQQLQLFDPVLNKTIVQIEQVLINKRPKNIRRVYIMDHKYRVGWVVDWDIHACMVCHRSFGWFYGRFKHHCRACGYLVCHDCSPYSTAVPGIDEPKGSRVCSSCYGLKSASLLGYGGVTASMTNTAASSSSSMKALDNSSSSSSATATTTAATTGRSYIEKEQPTLIATTLSSSPQLLIGEGDIGSRGSVRRRRKTMSGAQLSLYSSATVIDAMGGMAVDFDEQIMKMELEQMPFYEQDYRYSSSRGCFSVTSISSSSLSSSTSISSPSLSSSSLSSSSTQPSSSSITSSSATSFCPSSSHLSPCLEYRKMREYVPVDVHVSNLKNIIAQGLPEAIATRIWEMKILWLICMHKDDIYKV